ncbi:hypothetical protein BG60_10810 [Caballeronia zhejiangensis]|uniref:Uncharacterized protein n=1 Tax=Caballeronia zhejiangensis TaxID=871203 RepID=A0A656QGZ8_9BURK|nr:hypothetical protein BG60_10810 [Caballeronia zhejiangensis]
MRCVVVSMDVVTLRVSAMLMNVTIGRMPCVVMHPSCRIFIEYVCAGISTATTIVRLALCFGLLQRDVRAFFTATIFHVCYPLGICSQ